MDLREFKLKILIQLPHKNNFKRHVSQLPITVNCDTHQPTSQSFNTDQEPSYDDMHLVFRRKNAE